MTENKALLKVNDEIANYISEKLKSNFGSEYNSSISLRLPVELDNLLDELSITLNRPKTELLLWFIISGASSLEKEVEKMASEQQEIQESDLQRKPKAFMLNTNFTNDRSTHFDMLKNHEAAAFCDTHKHVIKRLNKGDVVYLYQSTRGFVARGVVDSELMKSEHGGIPDDKYSVKLKNFDSGFSPITAKQFKKLTKKGANFRMTLVQLDKEQHEVLNSVINDCLGN